MRNGDKTGPVCYENVLPAENVGKLPASQRHLYNKIREEGVPE